MRTQRYLPRIQNGRVAKRQTRSKNSPISKSVVASSPSSRRGSSRIPNRAKSHRGESSVMWVMIFTGVALAAGFVLALRSQISAHQLGQAEERLREKLDEYTSQQKFLMLDQQRALNASDSERVGKQSGLDQLKLDQSGSLRSASVQKVVERIPTLVKPAPVGQQNQLNKNRLSKQPTKNNQAARASVKSAAPKANAAKSNAAKSNAAKTKTKENAKQQQALRSQKRS